MVLNWSLLLIAMAAQAAANPKPAARAKPTAASGPVTAFVDVSVIPMDSQRVIAGQTVLVRDGKIAELGPTAQVKVPTGATRVDGKGKFLIPGLGDMHMLLFPVEGGGFEDWYVMPRLFCYVANGVTSVRMAYGNLGEQQQAFFKRWQDSVDKDTVLAPRILVQSTALKYQAGLKADGNAPIVHLDGYLDNLLAAADSQGQGGGGNSPQPLKWDSLYREPAYKDKKVDDAKIKEAAAATQKAGVWNIPTIAESERMIELWSGATAAKNSVALQTYRAVLKNLQASGAKILTGTGAPAWDMAPGAAVSRELERMTAAGLTPYQALETSTKNIAAYLGTSDSVGTIAPGKAADLVLLNGNPLDDITNTAKVAGTMVYGQWVSKSKIDAKVNEQTCAPGR
jgi:hypothetical protein